MRLLGRIILGFLLLALLGFLAWQTRWFTPRLASKPVTPPPTGASMPAIWRILAEGRLETYPGAKVTVSSEVAGTITNILVQETSPVKAGDLLVEIQADDVYASLMEAKAQVVEINSEIALAQSDLARARALSTTAAITPQELERFARGLETLQARHATALVRVKRLETTLAKTRISAPIPGVVLARYVHRGEVVNTGSPLLVLADLTRTRIEAEVDEYDAGRVRVGAKVTVRAEGYDTAWTGQVEEIPDRVAPRLLHPQDPAQPSDVRVLLVKVALEKPTPLKLGQRVEVEIQVGE